MKNTTQTRDNLLKELEAMRSCVAQCPLPLQDRERLNAALSQCAEQIRRSAAEEQALLACSRALLDSRTLQESARQIFRAGNDLIGATSGYLAVLSADAKETEVVFLDSGSDPCTLEPSVTMPLRGLREEVSREGRVIYENDFPNSERMRLIPQGHVRIENVLFAPLMIDDKVTGVIGLANKPGGFNDEDGRMARTIGGFAAIGLINCRMLQSLEESQARFYSVAQTAGDAIVVVDLDGKIVLWNRGAEQIMGYSAEEMVGRSLSAIVPERLREAHQSAMRRYARTRKSSGCRSMMAVPCLRNDGTEFPADLSITAWETREGTFLTGIVRDVTDRVAAAKQIERVRAGFFSIVENSPDAMLVLDEGGAVLYANKAAGQLFGTHPMDLVLTQFGLPAAGETIEVGIPRPGGDPAVAEMRSQTIDWNGQPATLAIFRDFTDRKRAEELQDKLMQEIKQFAYIISHDLRAPLINLRGFTAELGQAIGMLEPAVGSVLPGLPHEQKAAVEAALQKDIPEGLKFIDSAAQQMQVLTGAIRSLSRLETCALHMESIDMNALVGETLRTLEYQIARHETRITVGALPGIRADRSSMERIMLKLLTNALNYLDPQRPGEVEITGVALPGETLFRVRDNGRGIEKIDQERIFDIFRRAGKQDIQGEGAGLTYVRTIVRRHGGRLWCESQPGVGSVFAFSLPNRVAGEGTEG